MLWFIWGMFYGPEEVLGQVLFADAIDEHMRGRVYSFMGVVFSLAGMVGVPHHWMGGTSVRRAQHHHRRRGTVYHRHRIHVHSRPDRTSYSGAGIAGRGKEPRGCMTVLCALFLGTISLPRTHYAAGCPDNTASRWFLVKNKSEDNKC